VSTAHLQPVPGEFIKIATNVWTEPFWQATKEERLVVCQCSACGRMRTPPTPFCPSCQSQEINWKQLSGRGHVYSYTICHNRAPIPGVTPKMTYAPAVIELDDAPGVRLVANLVGMPASAVRIGLPVEITWQEAQGGWKVPLFRPVAA